MNNNEQLLKGLSRDSFDFGIDDEKRVKGMSRILPSRRNSFIAIELFREKILSFKNILLLMLVGLFDLIFFAVFSFEFEFCWHCSCGHF